MSFFDYAGKNNRRTKKERRQLILNISANIVSYTISIAISFVLTPFLIDKLGKEAYSFYPLSTSITNTMGIVITSLNSMASRFIVVNLYKHEDANAKSFFSSTLFVDFFLSLLLLIPMAIFVLYLDFFLNVPSNLLASVRIMFIFTFSSLLVNTVSNAFGVATLAKNRIDLRSYREIAASLVRLGLFAFLFFAFPPSLPSIGLVALLVAIFNLIVQFLFTKKLLPDLSFSRKAVSKANIKTIFSSSIWVVINALGNTLLASVTLFMLNRFYGPSESAVVSISLTIPSFMGGIVSNLVGVFYPVLMKTYTQNNTIEMTKRIKEVQILVGGLGCAVISVFSAVCPSFFSLWVPGEDHQLLFLLTIINMAPYLFTSCFWVSTTIFTVMNKVKVPAIATAIIGILNLLFQALFGFLGVNYLSLPIVCSLMQIVWTGIFMPAYLAKLLNQKVYVFYRPMIALLGLTFLSFAIVFALLEFVTLNSWLKFICFGAVIGLATLFGFFLLFFHEKNIVAPLEKE